MWMAVATVDGKLVPETARLFARERSARHYTKAAGQDWRALRIELTILDLGEIGKPAQTRIEGA